MNIEVLALEQAKEAALIARVTITDCDYSGRFRSNHLFIECLDLLLVFGGQVGRDLLCLECTRAVSPLKMALGTALLL